MTPDRLEQIRERVSKATPGPWHGDHDEYGCVVFGNYGWVCPGNGPAYDEDSEQGKADAEFVGHARTDVPDLLAEVERLTAELARVGICGDRLPGLVNYEPSSVCDLPAGHAGWCGADNPPNATGVQSRVSWTRDAQGLLGVVVATEGAQP